MENKSETISNMEGMKANEIDIIHMAYVVAKHWRYLLRYVLGGAVVGTIVAFSTPKEYGSEVILAPELSSGLLGASNSLSDIASSFGINLGNTNSEMDAIYPDLYPDIFGSTDFIQSLYTVPVRLQDDPMPRTYLTHIKQDWQTPWWNYPVIWVKKWLKPQKTTDTDGENTDVYVMSHEDWDLYLGLSSLINCSIDKKTSVITISVTDQDPMVAAILADTLQQRLQHYITNYRTNKARIDVEYYSQLAAEAKQNYDIALNAYADYADANRNMILESFLAKRDNLENDMQLKYNAYTQTLVQLNLAKAKLQERTPAFTIIQSAKANPKPVSMPRILQMIIWVMLALTVGIGIVVARDLKQKPS